MLVCMITYTGKDMKMNENMSLSISETYFSFTQNWYMVYHLFYNSLCSTECFLIKIQLWRLSTEYMTDPCWPDVSVNLTTLGRNVCLNENWWWNNVSLPIVNEIMRSPSLLLFLSFLNYPFPTDFCIFIESTLSNVHINLVYRFFLGHCIQTPYVRYENKKILQFCRCVFWEVSRHWVVSLTLHMGSPALYTRGQACPCQ